MKALFEQFDCEIRVTVEGRPEANGQVEIFNKTFKERLNAILAEKSKHYFYSHLSSCLVTILIEEFYF